MRYIKPGDWVRHERIEPALYVERIENNTAWLRQPSPDGWPFPVVFALPVSDVRRIADPTKTDDDFEEAPF
jgi:hypothetical protein